MSLFIWSNYYFGVSIAAMMAMLFSQESHSQPYVAPAVGATLNMVIFYGHDYDYDSDYDANLSKLPPEIGNTGVLFSMKSLLEIIEIPTSIW